MKEAILETARTSYYAAREKAAQEGFLYGDACEDLQRRPDWAVLERGKQSGCLQTRLRNNGIK